MAAGEMHVQRQEEEARTLAIVAGNGGRIEVERVLYRRLHPDGTPSVYLDQAFRVLVFAGDGEDAVLMHAIEHATTVDADLRPVLDFAAEGR